MRRDHNSCQSSELCFILEMLLQVQHAGEQPCDNSLSLWYLAPIRWFPPPSTSLHLWDWKKTKWSNRLGNTKLSRTPWILHEADQGLSRGKRSGSQCYVLKTDQWRAGKCRLNRTEIWWRRLWNLHAAQTQRSYWGNTASWPPLSTPGC